MYTYLLGTGECPSFPRYKNEHFWHPYNLTHYPRAALVASPNLLSYFFSFSNPIRGTHNMSINHSYPLHFWFLSLQFYHHKSTPYFQGSNQAIISQFYNLTRLKPKEIYLDFGTWPQETNVMRIFFNVLLLLISTHTSISNILTMLTNFFCSNSR